MIMIVIIILKPALQVSRDLAIIIAGGIYTHCGADDPWSNRPAIEGAEQVGQ